MTYIFSPAERDSIAVSLGKAEDGIVSYADVYYTIIDCITGEGDVLDEGVEYGAYSWLVGAIGVNTGTTTFASFIRTYTEAQYEIRYGVPSTDDIVTVSNAIAAAVAHDIVNKGVMPSLHGIGQFDALEVTNTYFGGDAAGWSGNPLFAFLGDGTFYDQNILSSKSDGYDLAVILQSMAAALEMDAIDLTLMLVQVGTTMLTNGSFSTVIDTLYEDTDVYVRSLYGISLLDYQTYDFVIDTINHSGELFGTSGADAIFGGNGADVIDSDIGVDLVDGGNGNDILTGGLQADRLCGGGENDLLSGKTLSEDFDTAWLQDVNFMTVYKLDWADQASDYLSGGNGNDILLTSDFVGAPRYNLVGGAMEAIPDCLKQIDSIDASDSDFVIYGQSNYGDRLHNWSISADDIAAFDGATFVDALWDYDADAQEFIYRDISVLTVEYGNLGVVQILSYNHGYTSEYLGYLVNTGIEREPTGGQTWTIYGNGSGDADGGDAGNDDTIVVGDAGDTVYGLSGDDTVDAAQYGAGNDYIDGGADIDTVSYLAAGGAVTVYLNNDDSLDYSTTSGIGIGVDTLIDVENVVTGNGNDAVFGSSDDNVISTSAGDDSLVGGEGDDRLFGGAGSDLYSYAVNDGDDVIIETGGSDNDSDVLNLSDLTVAGVSFDRQDSDLLVTVLATGQVLRVADQFLAGEEDFGIERIQFADGSVLDRDDILAAVDTNLPTVTVAGTSGADSLEGTWGDDVFRGGQGDDILLGSAGSDAYIFSSGDGNDHIDDEAGFTDNTDILLFTDLNVDDISLAQSGNNLEITVLATGEVITIDEQFYSDVDYWGIEQIQFADGSVLDRDDILAAVDTSLPTVTVAGTSGADILEGTWGDDVFRGNQGDDMLLGSAGSDAYIFSSGDGNDYIDDEAGFTDNTDILLFTDLNVDDISLAQSGINLEITVLATGEVITIDEQFYSDVEYWGIEQIQFADGSVLDRDDIVTAVAPAAAETTSQMSAFQRNHSTYEAAMTNSNEVGMNTVETDVTEEVAVASYYTDYSSTLVAANNNEEDRATHSAEIISLADYVGTSDLFVQSDDIWYEPEPIGTMI